MKSLPGIILTLMTAAYAAPLLSAAEERDNREELPPSLSAEPPQGPRTRSQPPFFGRLEGSLFASGILFSDDFESDPSLGLGALLRVPVPGLPTGRFGLFAEYVGSTLERDLEDFRDDTDGLFHTVAVGGDFAVLRHRDGFFSLQAAGVFLAFGDITGLEDGWGAMGGAVVGIYWIKGTTSAITFNPQIAYDGEDWVLFLNAGFNFPF